MVATGPVVLSTSLAVPSPALQPSMSPAAVNTGPSATAVTRAWRSGAAGPAAASAGTVPRVTAATETAATSTAAAATDRRHDDRTTTSPLQFPTGYPAAVAVRHLVRILLFCTDACRTGDD